MDPRDRRLGMDRPISRRDFLNGVRVGAAGLLLSELGLGARAAAAGADAAYPPALTGLRGNHPGSFAVAELTAG